VPASSLGVYVRSRFTVGTHRSSVAHGKTLSVCLLESHLDGLISAQKAVVNAFVLTQPALDPQDVAASTVREVSSASAARPASVMRDRRTRSLAGSTS